MKNILKIILMILLVSLLTGCSDKFLLKDQIESSEIDRIQIITAMGNPEYGIDSKIITSPEEIKTLTDIFNIVKIGDKVHDDELEDSFNSSYLFFKENELIKKFDFNGNNTNIIWNEDNWYQVKYDKDLKTPFQIYEDSKAEIILVDIDGNEMIIEADEFSKFDEEEINKAMDIVKEDFNLKGCTLKKVWYEKEKSNYAIKGYLGNGKGSINGVKPDNVIVLFVEFDVDNAGGDGSFEPDSTYSEWQFILIRDDKENHWRIDDMGY